MFVATELFIDLNSILVDVHFEAFLIPGTPLISTQNYSLNFSS